MLVPYLVRFINCPEDSRLNDERGLVVGRYADDGLIILLVNELEGYDPAIVMTKYCVESI